MPYNGSGGFTRLMNWQADAAAGTKIKADRHDSEDDNFASGLGNVICKDGQSSPTADIPFNTKKITGLADPINDQDAVTKKYMLGGAATQGLWTKLGFASADMSILGRAADGGATPPLKQRIVFNNAADGTGTDVFAINDDGTFKVSAATVLSAETRNRVVNGAMQISQENAQAPVGDNGYPADQWRFAYSSSSTITARNDITSIQSDPTHQVLVTAATADSSATASEHVVLIHAMEGSRVADFGWGQATSRQAILAFDVWMRVAGTYWISITNAANTHSFTGSYTVSAGELGAWTRKQVIIPQGAINAGVWPVGAALSFNIRFIFHCGPTLVGAAGFQAGNFFAGPGQALGMSTTNYCGLTKVGLYLDPLATGIAPPWVMPDEAEELRACQRYYQKMPMNLTFFAASASHYLGVTQVFPVQMRITPALAQNADGSAVNATTTTFDVASVYGCRAVLTATAAGASAISGRTGQANARM